MEKHALIISAGAYQHPDRFKILQKTTADAEGLAKVFSGKPANFSSVTTLVDQSQAQVKSAVQKFYKDRATDDLLLLYFSGHGVRNDEGELFLALVDTDPHAVEETAVDCSRLRKYMNKSRSKRQLVILDCCHSGAFDNSKDAHSAVDEVKLQLPPAPDNSFDASKLQGRFVITATGKTSLAFERDEGAPEQVHSIFTGALIEAFTEKPATDATGNITVNSLYQQLRTTIPDLSDGKQQPQLISFVGDGDLLLVKSKLKVLPPSIAHLLYNSIPDKRSVDDGDFLLVKSELKVLPPSIVHLLDDSDPDKRIVGIVQLKHACLISGAMLPAALNALQALENDRDNYVRVEANLLTRQFKARITATALMPKPTKEMEQKQTPEPINPKGEDEEAQSTPIKQYKDLQTFQDTLKSGGLGPTKVVFRAGTFLMGSPKDEPERNEDEGPQREVAINPFSLGQNKVTFNDYQKFVKAKGKELPDDEGWGRDNRPVINVSWEDAQELTRWSSEQMGFHYHQTSEAEWEYKEQKQTPEPINPTGKAEEAQSTPVKQYKDLQTFKDTLQSGGLGPTMVVIPAGTFLMGSPKDEPKRDKYEGPQRKVAITRFALGQTEITFNDYQKFVEAKGKALPKDNGWGRENRPVINVSCEDAQQYASWLSAQTGFHYRLPSESEWEYAARAGTTTPFNTGQCITQQQAQFGAHAKDGPAQTAEVASYPANAFGLYDMHGNVWEWVADCWHENYDGAPADGKAWLHEDAGDCSKRVVRGGSWITNPRFLRSATRHWYSTDGRFIDRGFRLARTLEQ
ncbi:caspase, EACC1-associated type [Teredinibacter turnerae]|uniref:caspase, EACC1-associated type n=1 Tax=Teredinibacter turnerae TaxID=2426 RepID=UPI00037352CD|nr:SUMF1/EgtB/PvdO family nonheme iron enzyme [Teredinibacter turnerae]